MVSPCGFTLWFGSRPVPQITLNAELWLMCVCLYLGVLLLDTGSEAIDLALELATVVTMVLSLWTVSVMDLPFAGAAQVRFSDLCVVPEEMVRQPVSIPRPLGCAVLAPCPAILFLPALPLLTQTSPDRHPPTIPPQGLRQQAADRRQGWPHPGDGRKEQ